MISFKQEPGYRIGKILRSLLASLPRGQQIWRFGCVTVWLCGYVAVWLYGGYMAIWLFGHMATWLHDYMAKWPMAIRISCRSPCGGRLVTSWSYWTKSFSCDIVILCNALKTQDVKVICAALLRTFVFPCLLGLARTFPK